MTDLERLILDDEYDATRACVVQAGKMWGQSRGTLGEAAWARELAEWVARLNEVAYRRNQALSVWN